MSNNTSKFGIYSSQLRQKGYLAYEYNPLHNYRVNLPTDADGLTKNQIKFQGKIYDLNEENVKSDKFIEQDGTIKNLDNMYDINYKYIIQDGKKVLVSAQCSEENHWEKNYSNFNSENVVESGSIVDLDTDKLNFSLNHPVNIDIQESYDGSVNLILNDNYNIPRLINSRFTPHSLSTYEIVDRLGNNDTNLYDDNQFDLDTSLYKIWNKIPRINYKGVIYNGNLKVGNYFFYFKYADADGNETDFVGESGLVSVFIGNDKDPFSINGGYKNMNSHKGVQFYISNIDQAYDYLVVYYTRSYADLKQNRVISAYKINNKFTLHTNSTYISIFGTEDTTDIPISDLNTQYFVANKAATQVQCSNRLFLGNVSKPNIDYKELSDLSLHIYPTQYNSSQESLIGKIDKSYNDKSDRYEYYNTKNIYNYVGYWPEEIYRFGIVYILSDNTKTSVFNIKGANLCDIQNPEKILNTPLSKNGKREYLNVNEENGLIEGGHSEFLENGRGVVRFGKASSDKIIGVQFNIPEEVKNYLKDLGIKGFFFVRQKRIPTILAQALLIPFDSYSHLPLLKNSNNKYFYESFFDNNQKLKSFNRTIEENNGINEIEKKGVLAAICPEFEQNMPYFNQFFTGSEYKIKIAYNTNIIEEFSENNSILRQSMELQDTNESYNYDANIISVTEEVPTVAIKDSIFKLIAGEAEDVTKYSYIGKDETEINWESNKLPEEAVRGIFGPYLGVKMTQYNLNVKDFFYKIINIYIPNYSESNMKNYFEQRYQDDSTYYSISNYYELNNLWDWGKADKRFYNIFYKGDCYTCQYTHRVNRNFNDPSSPNNDIIVDKDTLNNIKVVKDGGIEPDSINSINRGDLNAVKLGTWITFRVRSSSNLCLRSVDQSYVAEAQIMGSPRSFYPYSQLFRAGENKIPESTVFNDGFRSTVNEKWYRKLPDTPYYKNSFENRILYSEIAINDAYKNGYRTFYSTNFQDYKKEYGKIVKLEELGGDVLCVFEKAVGLIPVNERTVAGNGNGGNVFINTDNVLPKTPRIFSNMYGSQWADSIVKTPYYIYGVDTRAKKIWRTNGQALEIISDFRLNKFLVDNITLKERELEPIIGIRNVKTHYNANKSDVMFTFYDTKEGFEEKAWNLCYNEITQTFTTFYSWVPSFSENIQNQFWSFDRDTSKAIAKLGSSKEYSTNSDGVILEEVFIEKLLEKDENDEYKGIPIKGLANRLLPDDEENGLGSVIKTFITYSLEKDNNKNYKYFIIEEEKDDNVSRNNAKEITYFNGKYIKNSVLKLNTQYFNDNKIEISIKSLKNLLFKNIYLDDKTNKGTPVMYLNIKAKVNYYFDSEQFQIDSILQHLISYNKYQTIQFASYQSIIALTSKDFINNPYITQEEKKSPSLCTDFWIHGRAGLIDIKENIKPTFWYGKQHPFEFEFVVNKDPHIQKIFTNLKLISNKAEPESFHYEIVGEGYEFAKDKENMYYRQEATKETLQHLGYDILYDREYSYITPNWEASSDTQYVNEIYGKSGTFYSKRTSKSTIFPQYYFREDTNSELYDTYLKMNWEQRNPSIKGSYNGLTGSEIVRNVDLGEYRILTHQQNLPLNKYGRRKGNSFYKEDCWRVQIPPIYYKQSNEEKYTYPPLILDGTYGLDYSLEQGNIKNIELEDLPQQYKEQVMYNHITKVWNNTKWVDKETKIRDKYIKIRVRYSGKELAIIHSIVTLFNYSYA